MPQKVQHIIENLVTPTLLLYSGVFWKIHFLNSLDQMELKGCIGKLTPRIFYNMNPHASNSAHLFSHARPLFSCYDVSLGDGLAEIGEIFWANAGCFS